MEMFLKSAVSQKNCFECSFLILLAFCKNPGKTNRDVSWSFYVLGTLRE